MYKIMKPDKAVLKKKKITVQLHKHTSSSTCSRRTENGTDSSWSEFPGPLLNSFFLDAWKSWKTCIVIQDN